jgi:hypothetical protein
MSGTHGLLQPNQPGYYYITLEESYVTLFKIAALQWYQEHKDTPNAEKERDARLAHAVAKAYITDVLANLSNDLHKQKGSEKNLWVFLSFSELEQRLHGACKMRVLKDAMKEMTQDGYVEKRPNHDPRYSVLEYRLNLQKYRNELKALPAKNDRDDSANMHDPSANMHDPSANMHDPSANMHDPSANMHAIRNLDITNTKLRGKVCSASSSPQPSPSAAAHTGPSSEKVSSGDPLPHKASARETPRQSVSSPKANSSSVNVKRVLSVEVQSVIQEWQEATGQPLPVTIDLIKQATTMAAFKPQPGELARCREWMYQTDKKGWYKLHGMDLGDIARQFERFRSLANIPQPQTKQQSAPTTPKASMMQVEAEQLACDAIEQGKQSGYAIQAQAVPSKKVAGAWLVKVAWPNDDGLTVPLIKSPAHWQAEFDDMHKTLNMELLGRKVGS